MTSAFFTPNTLSSFCSSFIDLPKSRVSSSSSIEFSSARNRQSSSALLRIFRRRSQMSTWQDPRVDIFFDAFDVRALNSASINSIGSGSQDSYNSAGTFGSSANTSDQDADAVPMPMVLIDQDSDVNATIVQLSFGDRLGTLIEMVLVNCLRYYLRRPETDEDSY